MKKIIFTLLAVCMALGVQAFDADKWYTLKSGNKALIIKNASMQNAAALILWTPTNVPSQLWQIEENEDGTCSFREGYMGEYLSSATTAKANVKITARTASSKSRNGTWLLQPVEGKTDTYRIASKDGAFLVAVSESADDVQPALVDINNPTGQVEWKITEYDGEVQTSYNEAVRDDIFNDFMGYYYHPSGSGGVLGNGGWWGDAEMFETILDGFETTGDKTYQNYWTKLRSNFTSRNGTNWSGNDYNDDITWMVLACVRAYKYFGGTVDLQYAKDNFDRMWNRAIEPSGTLRWKERDNGCKYGTNSCINCPAINAACYLYEMTGEEGYLDKAKSLWEAQYNTLCDKNDGHVWDSGSWDSSWTTFSVGNYWGSTYNQGTMLGACVNLYRLTGDIKYKNYAKKVFDWSFNSLCAHNNATPDIMSACQTAVGDLCGFKGILMRYCRLYAEEFDREDILEWMEKNAWFAYQNANSKGIIWSKWLTKTSEDFKSQEGNEVKSFANDPFGASTAVSVAFNAHVNRVFHKDAYSTLGAEIFDDIRNMQISETNNDGDTPNATRAKNGWICFKNVQFGDVDGATQCELRLYASSEGSTYAVYIDKISEETKLGTVTNMTKGWDTYTIDIPQTTGSHKVFAVTDNDSYTMFHSIRFDNLTSGVNEVYENEYEYENGNKYDDNIYNLAGQRISSSTGYKGIVIKHGKKIMVQ